MDQLAYALGTRDERANMALAGRIAKANDRSAVTDLVAMLSHKTTGIRNSAIKVLYEVGELNPELLCPHTATFLALLGHKDNRMIWGAMSALARIARIHPEPLAKNLVSILAAMDSGTVITRDNGMAILASVGALKKHHKNAMELMHEQISAAPVNQVPMYAEKMAGVISQPYVKKLISMLKDRHDVWAIDSKARRLDKLIRSLQDMSA